MRRWRVGIVAEERGDPGVVEPCGPLPLVLAKASCRKHSSNGGACDLEIVGDARVGGGAGSGGGEQWFGAGPVAAQEQ